MSAIDLLSQLDDEHINQISQQIGADPAQTRSAIQSASPMLLAGMAQTTQQPDGQAAVLSALDTHGGLLDNLRGMFNAGGAADGGILDKILGQARPKVEDGVQKTSGLNGDQAKKLLAMLAPVVIAMLAKRRANNADAAPIDTHVREEAQRAQEHAERRQPGMGGILGKILSHVEAQR
jgi:hypothetical protein